MRFLERNTPRMSDEEFSAPSSVQSVDSYEELFGSCCSDYTDCEYCEDRRRRQRRVNSTHTPSSVTPVSYFSAMDRIALETSPLLRTLPAYEAVTQSSDSLGPADLSSKAVLATYQKLEDKKKHERKKQSSLVTIFSLWNTTMGSSLLTMAWGVERAGLFPALLLLVAMGGLCLYTACTLLRVNRHHGGEWCEVPALCRTLLGGWAEKLAHAFSLLVLLGANIVYWILITNFLYFTVNYFVEISHSNATEYNSTLSCNNHLNTSLLLPPSPTAAGEPAHWSLHGTVPVYVALMLFPILNFRNASFFTKFNSLGTLSVLYLLIFVIVKGVSWGINFDSALVEIHAGRDAAVLSGMLALSFYIHNIIITIMNSNENQENNNRDLTIAFLLVTLTYTFVGAVFYICFPLVKSCIEDNILNNFEMHDVMTAVARILLLFQVITVYPLVAFMLRSEAILLLPLREEQKEDNLLTITINLCIVIMCILFACFCPNIGTIIRYTGAVSGLVHVFALPSLLQLRSLYIRDKLHLWNFLLYVGIIAFGTGNLIMQFFVSE